DIGEVVREHVALHLPMKPVCFDDCRGLCLRCGVNWHTDTCDCSTDDVCPSLAAPKVKKPERSADDLALSFSRASGGRSKPVAVPKRRTSRARTKKRRSVWAAGVSAPTYGRCEHCHEPKRSHGVCPECGYYRGRRILVTKQDEG